MYIGVDEGNEMVVVLHDESGACEEDQEEYGKCATTEIEGIAFGAFKLKFGYIYIANIAYLLLFSCACGVLFLQ